MNVAGCTHCREEEAQDYNVCMRVSTPHAVNLKACVLLFTDQSPVKDACFRYSWLVACVYDGLLLLLHGMNAACALI